MKPSTKVLQFKITLRGVKPPIWRRIQVPKSYSFWDLHVAIQDAMGWTDSHLHAFVLTDARTGEPLHVGIPDDDGFDEQKAGWDYPISSFFRRKGASTTYEYDFGDGWEHLVVFEGAFVAERSEGYPVCLAGRRRCPPEDCGGVWGYQNLLQVISDPDHEEHEEMLEWVGGPFDPDEFDPHTVAFDDPAERRRFLV